MIDIDNNTKIIDQDSEYFPIGLFNLLDCPVRIYALGNESLLKNMSVAIVGTRSCSDFGKSVAKNFSNKISEHGITIISGMADGIDEAAHLGALERGNTIAVVAGGFKEILKGNKLKRAINILEHNGLIISEYHPDYIVRKGMFLQRNRLIAAIASATIIIEAPLESGAINTAYHALRLNRPLYAVPWSLNYSKGEGCNTLFYEGAKPLIDINKVLIDLKIITTQTELDLSLIKSTNSKVPDEYLKYYDYIKNNAPCQLESIVEFFREDFIGNIISTLTYMELNNYIKQSDKGYYIK